MTYVLTHSHFSNRVRQGDVKLESTVFSITAQNSNEAIYNTNYTNRDLPKVPEFQKAEESDYIKIYEEIENSSETYVDMDGLKSKDNSGGTYELCGKY